MQFWGRSEWALEFGDYEVNLTVPEDHIVDATGVLQNEKEVLSKTQRKRWEKARKTFVPQGSQSHALRFPNSTKKRSRTKASYQARYPSKTLYHLRPQPKQQFQCRCERPHLYRSGCQPMLPYVYCSCHFPGRAVNAYQSPLRTADFFPHSLLRCPAMIPDGLTPPHDWAID